MSVDPSVIAAVQTLVDADPSNPQLQLHLGTLLYDAGRVEEALTAAQAALASAPDLADAAILAARAAEACGQPELATRFTRLATALGAAPPPENDRVTADAEPDAASQPEDELDAFLREVLDEDARHRVTLDDVGGLTEVKERIRTSFLGPLANPELRAMYGASLRGGLLLYGPPGCGKTFLARAVAGELGARFLSIGLHDVLDMWLGNSERNLHSIFENARRIAPCVLFFDEVDALGRKREQLAHAYARNVVAQFLSEMDSIKDDNTGVFVLGATNAPWDVDPAMRRPGRFDRTLLVLPPDRDARAAILALHLRDRPVERADTGQIADRTEGFSGADLRLICNSAAEIALADSIKRGVARPIGQQDLIRAAKDVRPSTRGWFETARNYATFANQDGEFDDLLAYMRARRMA